MNGLLKATGRMVRNGDRNIHKEIEIKVKTLAQNIVKKKNYKE